MHDIGPIATTFGILDHVPVGVFILRRDFAVLFWNACLEDWTGISRDALVGKNIADSFPHLATPRYASRLQEIFEGGPPTIFSSQLHDHIIPSRLSPGRMRIQHTVITAIRSGDGDGFHALFAIQDVTDLTLQIRDYRKMRDQAVEEVRERKKVEEELIRTQETLELRVEERTGDLVNLTERLRSEVQERKKAEDELTQLVTTMNTLIDHIPEGALLLDTECRVVLANSTGEQHLTTLSAGLRGDILTDIAGHSLADLLESAGNNTMPTVEIAGPSNLIFTLTGCMIGTSGNPQGMVLLLKDVTEERNMAERIQSQERLAAVGQLAAGVAHDFNNILTGIIGLSEMMLSEETLQPEDRQMVEAILNNGLRAAHLIRQILDFSRKSISERQPLDLAAFLRDFIKFITRTIPETITTHASYSPGEYLISADPTKLQQVLANLALNARDAMPEGGSMGFEISRISVRHSDMPPVPDMPDGDWVLLRVSDTGTGMTPEVFSHIFEPFFTTKDQGKGTGLGLSQVYGIVKQHDGFLDVRTAVGEGTTFSLYLPAAKTDAEVAARPARAVLPHGDAEMIMVVEDDETVRTLVMRSLSRLNFTIVPASNGNDALSVFGEMRDTIRLVITDLVMPGMGGIEMSRLITRKKPGVKIIALTGYPLRAETADLSEAGIVDCIQKPFQVQTLVQAVMAALGK
ncbi:MAG: response regulator [Nitrospiraceae bacterium]|nr:response regulator [Nitrospiraceae bacterium]